MHSGDVTSSEHFWVYPHNDKTKFYAVKCALSTDLKYFPRFDYFRGFVQAPEVPFYSFYENLNCFKQNQQCFDASSYNSLLIKDQYDPDRVDIAYRTDWGGKLVESNTRGISRIHGIDWKPHADSNSLEWAPIGGTISWTKAQVYFERNVMRPILFQMKPEYLDGNIIPMECYLEVQIKHTFKVLVEKRFNAPNEEKYRLLSKVPSGGRDPPEGSKLPKGDFNIVHDDQLVGNIPVKYYLSCSIDRVYEGKQVSGDHMMDSLCNVYVPALYPLITGRNFLGNPNKPVVREKKALLPQRLDEEIPDKHIRLK